MPRKKLTDRQRRQVEEKEKQIRFQRQQNSIERLSVPQEKFDPVEAVEMDGPKKANLGLHLAHEHPVITRDMQMPVLRAAKLKKGQFKPDLELKIKGWNMTGEFSQAGAGHAAAAERAQLNRAGHGQQSDRGAINFDGAKGKDFFEQRKFSQAGSENFHLYS